MTATDYRTRYEALRAEGEAFESHIARLLYERCGWDVQPNYTLEGQRKGENRGGVEVKFDRAFRRTGNLFIEVAEKAQPPRKSYVPSGVMRSDNAWLWVIGSYEEAFVFGKRSLRRWVLEKGWRFRQTETSQGFLMPVSFARDRAEMVLR